jgi:hypothetical protein
MPRRAASGDGVAGKLIADLLAATERKRHPLELELIGIIRDDPSVAGSLPALGSVPRTGPRREVASLHALALRQKGDVPGYRRLLSICDADLRMRLVHELGNHPTGRGRFAPIADAALADDDADVRASALYFFGQWASDDGDAAASAGPIVACAADHRKAASTKRVVSADAVSTVDVCVSFTARPQSFAEAVESLLASSTDAKTRSRLRAAKKIIEEIAADPVRRATRDLARGTLAQRLAAAGALIGLLSDLQDIRRSFRTIGFALSHEDKKLRERVSELARDACDMQGSINEIFRLTPALKKAASDDPSATVRKNAAAGLRSVEKHKNG